MAPWKNYEMWSNQEDNSAPPGSMTYFFILLGVEGLSNDCHYILIARQQLQNCPTGAFGCQFLIDENSNSGEIV